MFKEIIFKFELGRFFFVYLDVLFDVVFVVVFERFVDGKFSLSDISYCERVICFE